MNYMDSYSTEESKKIIKKLFNEKQQIHIKLNGLSFYVLENISLMFNYNKSELINYLIIDNLIKKGFINQDMLDNETKQYLNIFSMNLDSERYFKMSKELQETIMEIKI